MNMSKWFTYENGLVVLFGISFGLVAFDRNAITVLMPFITAEFSLSNSQIGLLTSGLALSMAISAYLVGSWSDNSSARKPFLICSVIIFSLCSVLSGFASTFLLLLIARVVMGAAEGPFLPISLSVMNSVSSPARRGLNAGIIQSFFASIMASTLAPIVLVYLAELYSWRVAFFITGVPGVICAFFIWKFLREPKTKVNDKESEPISEQIEEKAQQDTVITEKVDLTGDKAAIGVFQLLKVHNIRICCLISCFMVGWFIIGTTFLPTFLTSYRDFEPSEMARLMAVLGVCTVFFGLLLPALSDRIGRKPVVIIFSFVGVIAPLTALYFDGPLWVMSALLFVGWSGTGMFPLFMAVIPGETVSRKVVATSMGLVVCCGELIGGAGGPIVAGLIADQSSLAAPVIIAAICAFCGGVLGFFLIETAPSKTVKM